MNLKTKFSLSVIALITTVVVTIGTMTVLSERRLLKNEIGQHQIQLVKRLAQVCEESLLQNELILFNYLKGLENEQGFYCAGFVNLRGQIQTHSDPKAVGGTFKSPKETETLHTAGTLAQTYVLENGTWVEDFAAPVKFGAGKAGVARILFNKATIESSIRQKTSQTIWRMFFISLIALLLGLGGAVWLSKTMVSPIHTLVQGMREVAHGRLEPLPELTRKDELGWMLRELNLTIQKLKELDEMKREFTASVTHELRSPLNAIQQLTFLGLQGSYGSLSSELKETLLMIRNNAIRLGNFVDDLLSTAKLESKRIDLFCENFDVRKVVQEVHKFYSPVAKEKGLEFQLRLPHQELLVWADQGKVNQILTNLVSNAFKFTQKGMVSIKAEDLQNQISISISDSGIGIDPKERGKIFDKFFRGQSTAHQIKGTGLGLSIVKGLLELQGGNISNAENPGGGSIFSFTLPKPKNT